MPDEWSAPSDPAANRGRARRVRTCSRADRASTGSSRTRIGCSTMSTTHSLPPGASTRRISAITGSQSRYRNDRKQITTSTWSSGRSSCGPSTVANRSRGRCRPRLRAWASMPEEMSTPMPKSSTPSSSKARKQRTTAATDFEYPQPPSEVSADAGGLFGHPPPLGAAHPGCRRRRGRTVRPPDRRSRRTRPGRACSGPAAGLRHPGTCATVPNGPCDFRPGVSIR